MKKTKLLLILFALFAFGQMAWAQSIVSVNYVDENGLTQPVNAISLDEIAQVNPNGATIGTSGFTNCYVVQGSNVVMNGQLGYNGGINLILCDGAKLTINTTDESAIQSQTGNNQLTIYVQANGTGQLIVNASNNNGLTTEYLTINGGVISVTSGGTGIHAYDNLIINRGTVTVNSDGNAMYGYNVTINGGNVSATSTGNAGIANGATGTITLGYTTNNDRIYASSYQVGNTASLKVKDGQYFITDDGQFVYGGYGRDYVGFLAGRTLSPFVPTEWSGGGDSASDPYIIASVYDLNLLSLRARAGEDYTGKYFRLDANIAFTHSTDWNDPSNPESNFTAISAFDGHFNGNSHTISGFRLHTNYNFTEQKGLFDRLGPNAYIENLTISNARIAGEKQVGAVAGYAQEGATVTNCHVTGTVTVHAWGHTLENHGGIVGANYGTVSNCVSEATISRSCIAYDNGKTGGIVGTNHGTLSGNKVFNANLTVAENYGAIAGLNDGGTLSNNYYHACTVNGTANTVNIGVNGADITTSDGAMSIHTITKPNDVTITTDPTLVYGGTNYWKHGTTITLSGGLDDQPTAGWQMAYFVNNVANISDPFTPSNTFTITPARDIEITIGEIHGDWANEYNNPTAGSSSDNPYKIYFTDQLDLLATRVNDGTHYIDSYFKLMNDLTYSYNGLGSDESNYTPIGFDETHSFQGHFDGNNKFVSGIRIIKTGTGDDACNLGLFGFIKEAEVKDVTIKDTQIVGHQYLGGVVGYSWSTMVSGCHVWYNVSIFLANNDSNTAGGIVGYNRIYYTSTVTNCTSEVHIQTNTNSQCYNIGGIVGLNESVVSNNFVMLAQIGSGSHLGAIVGFCDYNYALSNNYYRDCVVNNASTNVGCDGADVTESDGACPVFTLNVPGNVSANATPTVTYNTVNYYKEGVSVSLNGGLSGTPVNPGTQLTYYVYGAALLSSNLTPTNTFNMQAGDAVVTVDEAPADWAAEQGAGDTEENPYKIYYTEQLDLLATCVNSGTNYAGKYFKLMNNLTYDNTKQNNYTAIGNSQAHPFRGHFDGNNKTISGIRIYKSGDSYGDQWQAVFGYLNDSTSEVKNLTVADADITAFQFAGGIVGFLDGGTITNCHATSTVFIRAVAANANSHGGIVGDATAYNTVSEISHCTSSVTLTNTSSGNVKYYGAIVGAIRSGVTMSDNFAIEATVPSCANNDHGAIVGYNNGSTLARNYYHNCTVAGIANATNKGCDNANVVENDGAMPVFTLSLASGITADVDTTLIQDEVNYYKLGTTVALSCATPAPAGYCYVFSVNDNSIAGNTFDMEANSNVSVATEIIDWANAYSGTACDPYLIGNATQWDALAANVNNGMPYGDAFFKLTADISINTIVGDFTNNDGDHYYPFSGTFDGNGHTLNISLSHFLSSHSSEYVAPFACISGATIKNLHITGDVTTNGQRPASITSFVVENSTITNCWSEVDIRSSYDKDIDAGGLVARVNKNKTVTITDCLFSGSITYTEPNNKGYEGGGMVGWTQDGATATLKNCLFAPTTITVKSDDHSYIFVSGERDHVSITNCYYNDVANESNLKKDGTNASNVSSTTLLDHLGDGWEIKNYNVVPIITPYTFSGEGTEESPYIIASEADWNGLANNVYLGEIHSCDHFKMSNDISVTTMVGSHPDENTYISFDGTFDGDGHTLNVTLSGSGDCTAPFTCISGATIKNLHITGTIATTGMRPASIASFVVDNSTITNCWSEVAISSSYNKDIDAGGFVARVDKNKSVTLDGCLFTGSITYSDNNGYQGGGMVGWTQDGAYATLNNCYFAPSSVSFVKDSDLEMYMFIGGKRNHVTLTNCYYNDVAAAQTKLTPEDKRAYSITGGSGVSVENAGNPTPYNVSGITSYGTGIKYNNVLYAGNGDNVSLNLSVPEGYVISGNYSASAGTLNGSSNPYTLTMPNENVVITADVILTTIYREIEGYGDGTDKWAFIASPVLGSIDPTEVSGLIADPATDYDLYRLNPTNTIWENYKEHEGNAAPNFTLKNGRGYLYATKETKTLAFSGTFNTGAEPMTITNLPAGFNLVGNPFTVDAYVNKSYYTLNSDGSAIVAKDSNEDQKIAPCYGVIVEVGENETVTFNTTGEFSTGPNNGGLNVALTQANTRSNAVMDNAIVSFNEGSELGKFYFGEQNANIYIPQGGKDYAIAYSEGQGEMPLNFKATENGTYTLTINPEGVEVGYLHLIDNMTGNDIDLLAGASTGSATYTFTAKMTDYESRFKLVFSASADADGDSGTFAFFSNGNWIIANEGKATLQVIDINGRILTNETVNGSVSKAINAAPGVYVIRLINGDDVKVQKIVLN